MGGYIYMNFNQIGRLLSEEAAIRVPVAAVAILADRTALILFPSGRCTQ